MSKQEVISGASVDFCVIFPNQMNVAMFTVHACLYDCIVIIVLN